MKPQVLEAPQGTRPMAELCPGPVDEEDLVDWDVWLASPPPRPERTITVRLEYVGRDTPLPIHDPPEE